jgi:protein gp37
VGARPIEKSWVIKIRELCRAADVPFFFKQWGGVRKSEAGRLLEGCTYDEMPCRSEQRAVTQRIRLELIEQVNGWDMEQVA